MEQSILDICKGDEFILYKITHGLLVISSFMSTISYSVAIDQLKPSNHLFVGWCLSSAIVTCIYAIIAFIVDFKRRFDYARNHLNFLVSDLFLLLLLLPINISGSILWKYGENNHGKNGYDIGNVCLWISWLFLLIIAVQDNKQAD